MSRRWVKVIFSQSPAILNSLKSKRLLLSKTPKLSQFHPFKIKHLSFCTISSSQDDLIGLNDPDFAFTENGGSLGPQARKNESFSAKDFAFLHETLFDYDADSSPPTACKYSHEALLISEAIRNNGSDFSNKTEKFLRKFREKLDDSLVIDVLKLVNNPELVVKFFIWAGRQIGYSHTTRVYHTLLEILGFDRKSRLPEHFLKEIEEDDNQVLGKLLNVLIRKCCGNGLWNEALGELGRLKDFGFKPSKITYNALIQVLLKADQLDTAFLVHREMSDSGFSLDGFTLGCFAHSLCKVRRWREALNIIDNEEVVPDTVIYTKMISGLCEASLFEEAMAFLNRMWANSCVPNVVTYTTLLVGFLRKRQLGRCKRILSMMIAEGCYPSLSVFNSLIHAFCTAGEYGYAYKLLKKMMGCGYKPGYVPYNILIGCICGNEDLPSLAVMELAEKAYAEMLDAGLVLNKVNVGQFTRCLCGMGKFEKAFKVIREMMSKGFIPDTSTYSKVIGFLCQACKVDKAFILFEEMKSNGNVPDVFTYTILIDSFCKAGLIQQARNWFGEMVRDGCAPTVVTYTALIHAYLKARQLSEANELFHSMLTMGCFPNIVTYTALIDGLCKAGEVEKACQIYGKMRGSGNFPDIDMYFEHDASSTMNPNVFTYGALVDGLCKAHKVVEAHNLLEAMAAAGCEPNHVVYDALIDGFCKVGKLDDAQVVFTKMSERGYSPNVYTYSSLIDRLFKDKRLDLALKVLSKMLENSCAPNVITYTEMVDGLCKLGKTDEAYSLFVMMEEKGCCPNVVTYTAMIDGLGKVGKVDMCLDIWRQMTEKGCAPNFITYRVLINHCCTAGLLDEAHELLEEMKQTYWPMHVLDYSNVIQGFNREFITSLGLLEEISEYGSVPLLPAYSILIDSYCKAGKLDTALELYWEMLNYSPVPSAVVSKNMYSTLVESLCLASKVQKGFELYADMTRRGYIPELTDFVYLVKGLIKVNKWVEVLLLSYSICHMDIHWHRREEAFDGS